MTHWQLGLGVDLHAYVFSFFLKTRMFPYKYSNIV